MNPWITSPQLEKKFYKADFDQLLDDPQYSPYLDALLNRAMIRKMSNADDANVDSESYEEIRALSLELESDFVDPEA